MAGMNELIALRRVNSDAISTLQSGAPLTSSGFEIYIDLEHCSL